MIQAHCKSFKRSDFKRTSSRVPLSPFRTVSDYADTDGVGVLDEKLLWGAVAPSSPVLPQLQEEVLFYMAWLGCAFWHVLDFFKSPGGSLGFPSHHLTQYFWTDLSTVVMAHVVHALDHVDDGQKLSCTFLLASWTPRFMIGLSYVI